MKCSVLFFFDCESTTAALLILTTGRRLIILSLTRAQSSNLLHHRPTRPPRLHLGLTQLPQLVHLRRIPRDNPLRHIHRPTSNILPHNRINRRLRLHPNHANPRILRPTVMFPVSQIPQPRFETRRVVFLDGLAIRYYARDSRHGGPFAAAVEEGDVDVWVRREVVRFATFGIGVED
jgi:hypothetical protein